MAKKNGKPYVLIVLLAIIIVVCAGLLVKATQNQLVLLLVMAACLIGILGQLCKVKRGQKTAARPVQSTAAPAARNYAVSIETSGRTLSYRLAGVTYQGRQKWLKKMAKQQDEFEYVQCELEPYEWKGDPACRVLAYFDDQEEPVDIGNIPAAAAANVCSLIDRVTSVDVEVYGGPEYDGDDKSYGAEVTITIK